MKEKYEPPICEIVGIDEKDIIFASSDCYPEGAC